LTQHVACRFKLRAKGDNRRVHVARSAPVIRSTVRHSCNDDDAIVAEEIQAAFA
jgi:hypothetical protein